MSELPIAKSKIPKHVAIIMDGNGRWAAERELSRLEGHRRGAESVQEVLTAAGEWGISYLTLYAFSSENWKRPRHEVEALMALLNEYLERKTPELIEKNVRLQAIGRLHALPAASQQRLRESMEITSLNTGTTLVLALNYGAREEIVDAASKVCAEVKAGRISEDQLTPEIFAGYLDSARIPDPELMIRTSGEMRLSNFLLWQLSYTELVVVQTCWPDFGRVEFAEALREYSDRKRRFGGLDVIE